jgi:3-methyladenine DNA glycosylase/8-oxoguanine DNA glycosylase
MPTASLQLSATEPFWFEDLIFAHGWVRLAPYCWRDDTKLLERVEYLPSGRVVLLRLAPIVSGGPTSVVVATIHGVTSVTEEDTLALRARLHRAFVLNETFEGWHQCCATEPGLSQARVRRQGRMLRSPTVFEDVVKTICSINTTWAQTKNMVACLVEHYGSGGRILGEARRAFPDPAVLAAADPATLRDRARVGYRAETLITVARSVTEGRLDLEGLQDRARPDEEVAGILSAVRGLGPYAVAHMLMLLGRYDHLPVDTWLRRTVREAWFAGRSVSDAEILASFERFRPYRSLAYRFYDWEGAMRQEIWIAPGT